MVKHTSFNQTLKDLCLKLVHFVLRNNYVEYKELGEALHRQIIRTAMGTSFPVVYAVIFMIWLEALILNNKRFSHYILLYKQFIDDLFLIWTGPAAVICDFNTHKPQMMKQSALTRADSLIRISARRCLSPGGDG